MVDKLQLNYKMLKRLIPLTVHRFSSLSSTTGVLEPNSYNSCWEAKALKLEDKLEILIEYMKVMLFYLSKCIVQAPNVCLAHV